MQTILSLIAVLIFSVSASAKPSQGDSWETIRADHHLTISQGSLSSTFGDDGFFNACVDGMTFRSVNPIRVCTGYHWIHQGGGQEAGGSDEQICNGYAYKNTELPRQQTTSVCIKWQHVGGGSGQEGPGGEDICVKYQTTTVALPSTMNFGVYTYQGGHGGQESGDGPGQVLLFSKAYTVPACN